jgi:serine protease Do
VKSEFDAVSAITDAEQNLVGPLGILGIEIDQRVLSMAKGLRGPYGIIVAARAAGATTEVPLLVGDVIRDLNGKPMNTLDTLRSTLRSLPAGAPVTLQLQREGKLIYLSFTLD